MKRKLLCWCSARSSLITLLFSVTVLLCSSLAAREAWAHASGISGYSGNPATHTGSICTACHSPSGTAPTVALTGPTSLTTGTNGVYTLTITGGAAVVGGLDVSTTAGTLQATGPNTQLMGTPPEVTQTASTSFSGGSLSFTFTLVAPSTAGSVTLYAAGLSANGNGSTSGDNAAGTTLTVNVTAPSSPQIVISPANLQIPFGTVIDGLISDQTVTISNGGNANLNIYSIASANPLAAPFSIAVDNCSGQTITPAGACTLTVQFAPISAGTYTDSFDIPSNDPTTPSATMSVSGTGSNPPSHIAILPANFQVPFGTVNDGLVSDETVTISNNGSGNLAIGQIASANPLAAPFSIPVATDNCSNQTIAPAGTCTLIIQFAPTSAGTFTDSFDIPSNDPTTPSIMMSVSGTGNALPIAPSLVSPADGQTGVGTTATLEWNRSTDPDNDPITYHLYNCPGDPSASCTPVNVASNGMTGIYFAGSGLLFFGFVFTRRGRARKLMLTLMIAMLLMAGAFLVSCGSKSGGSSTPTTNMTYQVSGLNSAATYYWKVVADDGKGGLASSPTWSFTTK